MHTAMSRPPRSRCGPPVSQRAHPQNFSRRAGYANPDRRKAENQRLVGPERRRSGLSGPTKTLYWHTGLNSTDVFHGFAAARGPRAAARRARRHAADLVLCRARRERADAGARLQQAAARAHTWRPTRRSRPPSRPASPMRTTATSRRRRRARCPPRPPGLLSPLHSQSSEFRAHTSTGGACDLPRSAGNRGPKTSSR